MDRPDPSRAPIPQTMWPIASIEIVTLGDPEGQTYPIELGFARWRGVDAPIESWGCPVRLDPSWLEQGRLDQTGDGSRPGARRRSTRAPMIAFGQSAVTICLRLNTELFGASVCCGGLIPAGRSLDQLYDAAGTKPLFRIISRCDLAHYTDPGMAYWLDANDDYPPHARDRAVWLMRAFAGGLHRRPERIVLR